MNEPYSSSQPDTPRPLADTVSANGHRPGVSSAPGGHAILLIDDNPAVAQAMEIAMRMAGHAMDSATGPQEALSRLALRRYDAIVLDLNFTAGKADGREGLACLARIMADDPGACVVVLTAHGGIRVAVAAMQAGARNFAMKPWKNADLIAKVEAAIARPPLAPGAASAASEAEEPPGEDTAPARLLGESAAIAGVRDLIRRIGPTPAGVTITGPSGAGRTLAALALHAASADAGAAPLRVDLRDPDGWTLLAEGTPRGTVILRHPDRLDEVTQDRLVALLTPAIRPIAIADSLAALTPALRRRIATVELTMPALAQRPDDIALLARHFLRDAADRFGRPLPTLTDAAEAALRAAPWPDEVRGLALAMERAVLLADDGVVDTAALTLDSAAPPPDADGTADNGRDFDLDRSERGMIEAALREHHHNVSQAAKALGLSRGALYRRMERHGL